jgi:hypothetical protein
MKYGSTCIQCLWSKLFKSYLYWNNVEKYGTAVQATADNIIQRMRIACSVPSATDPHCEYVMIIAFCYMKALNVTLDLFISLSG